MEIVISDLLEYLELNIENYPLDKFTIHETIKGLILAFFLETEYRLVPELSKYKRVGKKSIKKRIDGVVFDKFNNPVIAIEIDSRYRLRNYETLMMWECKRLWIDYSSEGLLFNGFNTEGIQIAHLFKRVKAKNKFKKGVLRTL